MEFFSSVPLEDAYYTVASRACKQKTFNQIFNNQVSNSKLFIKNKRYTCFYTSLTFTQSNNMVLGRAALYICLERKK